MRQYLLYPIGSFLAGFVLMAFEILSARIIAPLVGASLYSWASVIGITLLGLSFGSWTGGALADTSNTKQLLRRMLLISSICIGVTSVIAYYISKVEVPGGILMSSIMYSSILFFTPSFFLGTIQPIILKEYTNSFEHLGKVYGLLSMLWSLGSIVGVVSVGFVLLSFFSITTITSILSVVCFLYACLLMVKGKVLKVVIFEFVVTACILTSFFLFNHHKKDGVTIFEKDTPYYHIKIVDFMYPQVGFTRSLFLDYDQHSSETKEILPYAYTNSFPLFGLLKKDPKDILVLGGGAYTLPKRLSSYYKTKVDVFEIDPEVPSVVKNYFGYSTSSITTTVGEGRVLLSTSNKHYDLIFGDTYNSFIGVPSHMVTQEYYEITRKHLRKGGIYAMSFASPEIENKSAFLKNMIATFASVYPNYYVFSFSIDKNELGSILLVGVNTSEEEHISEEELRKKIRTLGEYSFLEDFLVKPNPFILKGSTIFTDNYVPIENEMRPIMSEYFERYSSFLFSIHKQTPSFVGVVKNDELFFEKK
jgi:spermidine synthase